MNSRNENFVYSAFCNIFYYDKQSDNGIRTTFKLEVLWKLKKRIFVNKSKGTSLRYLQQNIKFLLIQNSKKHCNGEYWQFSSNEPIR